MALTQTEVSQLYVSVFGRASEGEGNSYWMTDAASTDMITTANVMLATTAASDYFGSTLNDNQAFIEFIYLNTLGKTYAEDTAGVDYWVAELSGGKSKGEVVAALITSAQDSANAGAAQDQFNNKVSVSDYTADTVTTFTDYDTFKGFISGVDDSAATVTSAKSSIDTAAAAAVVVNTSAISLTTSSDLETGTSGDDTFNGLVGTNTANGNLADTFQSVDILDGGAGTDTLNVSIASASSAVGPTVTNIEDIVFTAYVAKAYNMANTTGVSTLTNTNSIVNASFTNVGENIDVVIKGNNNLTTTVSYSSAVNTSLTDTQDLTLSNVTNQAIVTFTGANDIETLNITSSGSANKVDLGGTALDGATKITVAGDQNLSFDDTDNTNAMTAVKTLDASTYTGALDADLSSSATNLTVTGGSGDDKLTMKGLTKDDSIDLGDGTDTLVVKVVDAESVTTAPTLSNLEVIQFNLNSDSDDASEDSTFALTNATALTTVKVGATTAATLTNESQITLNKVAATCTTLMLNGDGAAADTDLNDVVFKLNSTTGTSDTLTISVDNTDSSGNLINSTKGVQLNGSVTANGIETITLNTTQLHADTDSSTQDGGLNLVLTDDKLQSLTISSSTLVDLNGAALDDSINTIDASGTSGGVLINGASIADADTTAASQTLTITMGSGNDDIAGLAADVITSTISLGAGNDSITLAGNDFHDAATTGVETMSIDAGAGNDTVDVSASTTLVAEGTISVTLGTGVDTIKIDGASTAQTGITVTDFTAGSGGDKIDLATSNAAQFGNLTKYTEVATGTLDYGMTVYTANDLASLAVADAATAFAAATLIDANSAGDKGYIVASDGTDTGLYEFIDAAGGTAIASGEIVLLLTLTGVSDASDLVVDNFTDFLA